ncbi:DUF2316 family protein [Gemella cuniculi]|uniref:DUF2316 family protein n=1 Tax=Gemella cuniculi TaxID=150240 RepID=UPI00040471A8|nr:DUF2316 family protein [Gemella cuniculi]
MLTPIQTIKTRKELKENYKRLGEAEEVVLKDLQISKDELHAVLNMEQPYPGNVWMVRDYLEDKLKEKGIEMMPFTRLADHSANKWFAYDTPWRHKKS